MRRRHLAIAVTLLLCTAVQAAPDYDWSVQYMIDESQTVLGDSQFDWPRDNRGLAISPDGRYLYAGYNNGSGLEQVRRIDLLEADYTDATVGQVKGLRGKAIATDDQGRVYMAEGSEGYIKVYSADLTTELYSIDQTKCEGVATRREGGQLVLYTSDRSTDKLTRYVLTEDGGGGISAHAKAGLGGTGELAIIAAENLRGLEIDASGNIWIADIDADKVWRVDGGTYALTSIDNVADAMDVGFREGLVYVTQYTSRLISAFDMDTLSLDHSLTAPWAALAIDPDGQSSYGAFSGLVMVDGGFYVTNEAGQTADEKSTYGRDDANSGWIGEDYYTDLYADDNEPIFCVAVQAEIPEPVTLLTLLAGVAVAGAVLRRSRTQE